MNSIRGSRNHDIPLVEGLYYNTPTKVVDVISAGTQILISKFYKTHQNDPFFGEVEWVTVYATILYGDNKGLEVDITDISERAASISENKTI